MFRFFFRGKLDDKILIHNPQFPFLVERSDSIKIVKSMGDNTSQIGKWCPLEFVLGNILYTWSRVNMTIDLRAAASASLCLVRIWSREVCITKGKAERAKTTETKHCYQLCYFPDNGAHFPAFGPTRGALDTTVCQKAAYVLH